MSREEYLEFITHQPYDAMGDFSFLLDEKSDKAENTTVENMKDIAEGKGVHCEVESEGSWM